jgi:hypothetical protein
MSFRIFGDRRDINQVIFDIAQYNRPRDHRRLFELLRDRKLFASIASSNVPLEDGRQFIVAAGDNIQLRTGSLPNGMSCVVFYVDRSDSRLGPQSAAMTAREAFEMVLKTQLDALLIQNAQNSWVAFPRQELGALRDKHF